MGSEIQFILFLIDLLRKVNPSTPRPASLALLRVDPERRFFTRPRKGRLGAAEWVKKYLETVPPCARFALTTHPALYIIWET